MVRAVRFELLRFPLVPRFSARSRKPHGDRIVHLIPRHLRPTTNTRLVYTIAQQLRYLAGSLHKRPGSYRILKIKRNTCFIATELYVKCSNAKIIYTIFPDENFAFNFLGDNYQQSLVLCSNLRLLFTSVLVKHLMESFQYMCIRINGNANV